MLCVVYDIQQVAQFVVQQTSRRRRRIEVIESRRQARCDSVCLQPTCSYRAVLRYEVVTAVLSVGRCSVAECLMTEQQRHGRHARRTDRYAAG